MYLIDTNIFVEAARRYYGFDMAPSFWKFLVSNGKTNKILTIDKVEEEIIKNKDDVSDWLKNNFKSYIKKSQTEEVITTYSEIISWIMLQQRYTDGAKAEYASVADGWLIAYAKTHNLILVTHEQPDPNIKKRIPIPNICQQYNVKCVNTFEMLRDLDFKFK